MARRLVAICCFINAFATTFTANADVADCKYQLQIVKTPRYASDLRLPLSSRQNVVIKVQNHLVESGHLKGPATGTFDQDTLKSVSRYQEINKLEVSGCINMQFLQHIEYGRVPRK